LLLSFFITVSLLISYIDIRKGYIYDRIIIPAFVLLALLKYIDNSLCLYDLYAVLLVLGVFLIPIIFNMAFGGGDLRFGAFCALFVGLEGSGYFILLSAITHLILLIALQKKSFAFAPAMSVGALGTLALLYEGV